MDKTVYAYDPGSGAYVAPVALDDGDLSPLEEGIYLIPGGCVDAAPPAAPAGSWPFLVDGRWEVRALPTQPEPESEPEPTLEQQRETLKAAVTAMRWNIETGGITLPGGIRVLTGKADQNRITSVIVNAQVAGIESVDFKADSGWTRLSIAEIVGIACAIGLHVQACFTAERAHHEAIDQLDAADIDTYDITAGWPAANLTEGA
jgi:hypothetical protein